MTTNFLCHAGEKDQQVASLMLQLSAMKDEDIDLKQRIMKFESKAEAVQSEASSARRCTEEAKAHQTEAQLQLAITRSADDTSVQN